MKRTGTVVLSLLLVLALCSCGAGGTASRKTNQLAGVNDVLAAGTEQVNNAGNTAQAQLPEDNSNTADAASGNSSAKTGSAEISYDNIDVDLTVLSSTMVYSEVYNMMSAPEKYIGKVVKMDGLFDMYVDMQTQKRYFACIIQDATACCAQGIEFELTDDYHYPYDYPKVGEDVCVVGVFDTYEENGVVYCTLRSALRL